MEIARAEFKSRLERLRAEAEREGLDALLIHSNESDYANVRYLSDYWPAFESAGVFLPVDGTPCLIIGPESEDYAADRSVLEPIVKLTPYRESAEPEYPDVDVSSFQEVFANSRRPIKRLGIVGWAIFPHEIFLQVQSAAGSARIEKADHVMVRLRSIKSDSEIEVLKEANRIAELAIERVLEEVQPGITELQLVGIAQEALYRNGAEYEGMPLYVFGGRSTRHAISRPTNRVLAEGEVLQLNIGARVAGYSSSVGRPVYLGKKMPDHVKRLIQGGLEAHKETATWMRPGVQASAIAEKYWSYLQEHGLSDYFLYGPAHGLGMIEVEQPWVETTSKYPFAPNMTFQVDTFLRSGEFGCRWEDAVRITETGVEWLSGQRLELIEVG